ncbi:hypothetical protein D3C75_1164860 [compost metagenome]
MIFPHAEADMQTEQPGQMAAADVGFLRHLGDRPLGLRLGSHDILSPMHGRMQMIAIA